MMNPVINSNDYHDYVFKDGKLVGEFDQMYQKSKDIPWHQDKDPERLDCKIALSILERKESPLYNYLKINFPLGE